MLFCCGHKCLAPEKSGELHFYFSAKVRTQAITSEVNALFPCGVSIISSTPPGVRAYSAGFQNCQVLKQIWVIST